MARAAGAKEETIQQLEGETADAKQEEADARAPPLGARLDSARAKVNQAEKTFLASQEAVEQALARQEDAKKQLDMRKEELTTLEAEVGRAPTCRVGET